MRVARHSIQTRRPCFGARRAWKSDETVEVFGNGNLLYKSFPSMISSPPPYSFHHALRNLLWVIAAHSAKIPSLVSMPIFPVMSVRLV